MNNQLWFMLVVIVVSLTGCSLIKTTPGQPIDIYTLAPMALAQSMPVEDKADNALVLALSPLRSSRGLMSSDIIYRDSQYGFDSYAYSRWSDSPTILLALLMQDALSHNATISAVLPREIANADLLLETTLLDFSHHVQNDDTSFGRVAIRVHLIDVQTKAVLATKQLSAHVDAKQRNAQGAASSINQASMQVVDELDGWLTHYVSNLLENGN
ncbi:MAG: membrane integrity-associated transporter subunit PqiC [Gammaproteobacteria bacterium]|nr:membrane integrity-associated transporter subunit PqiC [Gammaproteobacteria bacterium]